MFTAYLNTLSVSEIVDSVQKDGFFYCETALTSSYVDRVLADINFESILVNHNDVGVAISGTQRFLTHCLAKSKLSYDLITSRKVLDICSAYFTDRYQLTNHRFCQTRRQFHMPWHTDNNLQNASQLCSKHSMPGLLFLFYLSEQNRSPFQLIKNSHRWSHYYAQEIYLSDRWVETHHRQDVLTFNMQKGSLMICDIHAIHRAAPFCDREHTRNILLFQVDQVGDRYIGHGEQNLVNTAFIDNLSPELSSYLGFGTRRDYPAFPNSSVATLDIPDLLQLQQQLLPLMLKAIAKSLLKTLLPGEHLVGLKRLLWNLKSSTRPQ
ncbi:MAG: phytanoyl-CoA dioxygenase family protein [Synechococcales cyanobacterium M58_A2018_015]|nr:phytanoyl-CoA dioxygenase family protein [Synechococcales cyanobacterium M58_A2018_015]